MRRLRDGRLHVHADGTNTVAGRLTFARFDHGDNCHAVLGDHLRGCLAGEQLLALVVLLRASRSAVTGRSGQALSGLVRRRLIEPADQEDGAVAGAGYRIGGASPGALGQHPDGAWE
jgi:hypothetical protein